ncbi:glycosyltransferase family 39 protein [Streptomyces sp. NBC_00285]|uniref:glycosyltransferase family 39 protein n=1 Tax=Streptomyces sp. NBC_00285 TaxID=2975700 RepID=UPI002E27BE5B|nr:glycosyltransferase family 39 protein [Streptomyces sp. NBC_00285]
MTPRTSDDRQTPTSAEDTITQHLDTAETLADGGGPGPAAPGAVRPVDRIGRAASVVVPAVAALVSGLWGIGRQDSMWRDESVTYQVAHRSLGDLWGLLHHIDAVHGLYYLLMRAVFVVWDGGPVALRLPSVLASVLAAAGVGAIGARIAGPRSGTLAGLVFALLPVTQMYAQEGRSYALVTAGVIWATYFFVRATDAPGTRARWWTAYGLTLALACWLHEFAALAPLAHGLTLWWSRVPRPVWRGWAITGVCVAVSVLPLAVASAGQAEAQLGWLGRPSAGMWLQFLAISAAGALLCRFPGRRGSAQATVLARLALPLLIAPTGLLMAISLVKPWYVDRYVLYTMAGLALPAGAALSRAIGLRHRLAPAARALTAGLSVAVAVAVLLPWSLLVRSPESRKDDVVAVASTVERAAREGDGVLFMPSRRREWLLSYRKVYGRLDDLALAASPAASRTLQGTELPAAEIRRHILASDRVIALMDPPGQPLDPFSQEEVKRKTLRTSFEVCERIPVQGAQVVVYARPGHCMP